MEEIYARQMPKTKQNREVIAASLGKEPRAKDSMSQSRYRVNPYQRSKKKEDFTTCYGNQKPYTRRTRSSDKEKALTNNAKPLKR